MMVGANIAAVSMRDMQQQLNGLTLSRSTAFVAELADGCAKTLTVLSRDAFASGVSVYGDPRTHHEEKGRKFKGRRFKGRSSSGHRKGDTPLTLVLTGKVRGHVQFKTDGTRRVRAELSTKYARYLIGKYGILPNGRAAMPCKWSMTIRNVTAHMFRVAAKGLGR
jgi:hypothetical protein